MPELCSQTADEATILHHAMLRDFTTFKLGGPARKMILVSTPEMLLQCIQEERVSGEPFLVIGGGSNIVCSDEGLPCTVVRYVADQVEMACDGAAYCVAAGANLDQVVQRCVHDGLAGLTFASGIPGTLGGAVAGNAGAFGSQMSECVAQVEVVDPQTGQVQFCSQEEMGFDYRYSRIRQTGEIISRVWLVLPKGNAEQLQRERKDILALRCEKHPDWHVQPCAGSVFRNLAPPVPGERRLAAGKLLDEAGVHVLRVGGACVFPKHANIIIKESNECTAQDVFDLTGQMSAAVWEHQHVTLIPEIRFLGNFRVSEGQANWITGVSA